MIGIDKGFPEWSLTWNGYKCIFNVVFNLTFSSLVSPQQGNFMHVVSSFASSVSHLNELMAIVAYYTQDHEA
jgi:hypothetical protein